MALRESSEKIDISRSSRSAGRVTPSTSTQAKAGIARPSINFGAERSFEAVESVRAAACVGAIGEEARARAEVVCSLFT